MKTKTRSASPTSYPAEAPTGTYWGPEPDIGTALGLYGEVGVTSSTILSDASYIEYDTGKSMNYCLHVYDKLRIHPEANVPYGRCWSFIPYNAPNSYANSIWRGIVAPQIPPDASEIEVTDGMRARAWDAMYPEINNGLNLAVSIYEFRDFPRLLMTARRLLTWIRSGRGYRTLRRSRELMTDTFLSYNFGVLPILSDIQGLANDVLRLKDTINEFVERGKKRRPYHYREEVSRSAEVSPYSVGYIETQEVSTYYATVWLSYEYDVPPFWEALRRVGGLRLTASTVWNAMPWTFVVDWLVNVSDFLEQFDRDPRLTVKVHDYCDTMKTVSSNSFYRSISSESMRTYAYPHWNGGSREDLTSFRLERGDTQKLWTWEQVHYKRSPGLPNTGYALPVLDSLSNRQLVLAGALLAARR